MISRARGRLSRLVAAWLALCIGFASVQVAWAEGEPQHEEIAVASVTGDNASGGGIAERETSRDDGCGGLCLCVCHCPHAQPGAEIPAVPPPPSEAPVAQPSSVRTTLSRA